jgi:hypothetical protein
MRSRSSCSAKSAQAFVKSWKELVERIAGKSAVLAGADKENA